MTGPSPARPTFYTPAEVAAMLRCSAWWVKEQARNRRIPYCRIAGSYRFTDEHVAEIARLFEVQSVRAGVDSAMTPSPTPRPSNEDAGPVVQLTARVPRRLRAIQPSSAA